MERWATATDRKRRPAIGNSHCRLDQGHSVAEVMPTEISRLADLMNTGRYPEAEDAARTLLDRQPNVGFLWKIYGVALMRQAKDALPVLQRATQLLPDDAETYYYLGSA